MGPAQTVRWTRAQGFVLDALTGLAVGAALTRRLGTSPAFILVGLGLGAAVGLRWSAGRAARAIERALPETKHALTAWLEGLGGALRPRLEAWLAARVRVPVLRAALARAGFALALCLVVPPPASAPAASISKASGAGNEAGVLEVLLRVAPPAYSALPPFEAKGPTVEALRGSEVTLTFRAPGGALSVAEPGQPQESLALVEGRAVKRFTLERTRLLRVEAPGARAPLVLELRARDDAAPAVELLAPEEDRLVQAAPPAFAVRALARDDLGLASVALHFTLAQGTGESVHFRNGRLPTQARPGGTELSFEGRADPLALGMGAGDTLVLWAEATDSNAVDGPSVARSSARLLRWEVPVPQLAAGVSAMPPPPRSLLTQRELLARTERMLKRGLRGAQRDTACAELAQDQRALRLSFGQVLDAEAGNAIELDFDEKEAAETTDARARALLAQAVSSMWESESALGVNRADLSLAPQRAAVKALDAAFALVRYALRPGAQPDRPVDERRRLTGSPKGLLPRARGAVAAAPEPKAELLSLALALLTASANGLSPEDSRSLGDALWALKPSQELPAAQLASSLYAAADASERASAARRAGEALARLLRPARLVIPPNDPSGAKVIARIPPAP